MGEGNSAERTPDTGDRDGTAASISPTLERLADQIAWYDRKSQQLQQYQQSWTAYRSTCERLRHEKFLFAAHAGPYAGAPEPGALLAERVEGLVSQEHAAWVSHREEAARAGTRR